MIINARIDARALADATERGQRRLVFSVVQGINATAKKIQEAQRSNFEGKFTLRTAASKQFMLRNVAIIKPFASVQQGRVYAEVSVGQRARLLLAGYEAGADRPAFKGRLIARPVAGNPARPSFAQPVEQKFTFKAMKLKAVRQPRGRQAAGAQSAAAEKQYKGLARTFTIASVGVFVRQDSQNIKLLYDYESNQRLKAKLGWMQVAREVGSRLLSENISRALAGERL